MGNEIKSIYEIVQSLEKTIADLKRYIPDNYGNEGVVEPWTPYEPKHYSGKKKQRTHGITEDDDRPDIKAVFKYKPVPQLPTQIYVGDDTENNPLFLNMCNNPHALIAGATRSGKEKCVLVAITNLIKGLSQEDNVQIHLMEMFKSNWMIFKNNPKVASYTNDKHEILDNLKKIVKSLDIRSELIELFHESGKCNSIHDFNKLQLIKQIPVIYVFIDEIQCFEHYPDETKEDKKLTDDIWKCLQAITRYGANLGVYLILSGCRFTHESMPLNVQSELGYIVSFKHENYGMGEVVVPSDKIAWEVFTPNIDIDEIHKLITE